MFTPRSLKVRGFRGFLQEQEFHFDRPVTLLFGDNHCGKSSTLNALEWCLFGGDCAGLHTGIRERVGWVIPNQQADPPEVVVELRLDGPVGTYQIRRRMHGPPKKRKDISELELLYP